METKKNKNINKGAAFISIIFMLLFFVVVGRFGYIQATKKIGEKELMKLAEASWTTRTEMQAARGTIFGKNGEVLAQDVPAFSLRAILSEKNQNHVEDPAETASQLAPILNTEEAELTELLSKDQYQVEFGSTGDKISYEKKEKIEALDLPGIVFVPESKRYYPKQSFASYVLGFTDFKDGIQTGKMGIEERFDEQLQSENGSMTYMRDGDGVKLPDANEKLDPPKDGSDVYLTIDHNIQTFLEQAMNAAYEEYNPERIMAIVANPKTGEILAMGNRPGFNPNTRDITNYTNQAISAPFEPGSTMKIFTLAAAINEGVYEGGNTFHSGKYEVAGVPIRDHHAGGWGPITFNEGVRRSSNVGFSIIAREQLGFERFYDYLQAFGFTKKTRIALPNEAESIINFRSPVDKTMTSFGQASAVTAIQQIRAATAIANDGKMMEPHIVHKIVNPNTKETVEKNASKVAGQPITSETAQQVRELLGTVVSEEDGTGTEFAIEGYDVAGKTGTAQIPGESGYLNGEYIHAFLGMAPQKDPELIMYVAVDRPDVEISVYGSKPVADIFTKVMKKSLQYSNIQPSKKGNGNDNQKVKIDDYKGKPVEKATKSLKESGLRVVTVGSGNTVQEQAPYPKMNVLPGERIIFGTGEKAEIPDLNGWSLADVMKLVDVLKLSLEVKGSGYVVSQGIPPGGSVKKGDKLTIDLSTTPTKNKQENEDKKSESE
jgi:penicillin-binding protein 2B